MCNWSIYLLFIFKLTIAAGKINIIFFVSKIRKGSCDWSVGVNESLQGFSLSQKLF